MTRAGDRLGVLEAAGFKELKYRLKDALAEVYGGGGARIEDVYDSWFIYSLESTKLYRRDYLIGDDGVVAMGMPHRVRRLVSYEDVNHQIVTLTGQALNVRPASFVADQFEFRAEPSYAGLHSAVLSALQDVTRGNDVLQGVSDLFSDRVVYTVAHYEGSAEGRSRRKEAMYQRTYDMDEGSGAVTLGPAVQVRRVVTYERAAPRVRVAAGSIILPVG